MITNKLGLPQALVNAVTSDHKVVPGEYSVTEFIKPIREIILSRRHEATQDVSEMTNLIFGSAVHEYLEKHDDTGKAEVSLRKKVSNSILKGRYDLKEGKRIKDYKTATVAKVKMGDYEDYDKQGNLYAFLDGDIEGFDFIMFLKDWTAREARLDSNYPQSAIVVYSKDTQDISNQVYDKMRMLELAETMSDDDLPECEDTWYTGGVWAVYKKATDTKATKLCATEEEAKGYIREKLSEVGVYNYREGHHRKCEDYCTCKEFCKYGRER